MVFSRAGKTGISLSCKHTVASTLPIAFPGGVPPQPPERSSVTPRPASSVFIGGGKTVWGVSGTVHRTFYDHKVRSARDLSCGDTRVYLEIPIRRVRCRTCGKVKREALSVLSDNPFDFSERRIPKRTSDCQGGLCNGHL